MVNIIYSLPAQQNNKLRPWETKEKTEVKNKVSNSTKSAKDYVDIPEDLYNAVKPITQYYFTSIKNLINGKAEKSLKTKKISKDLLKAAVTPFTAYYAKHLKALQPLGSKVKFTKSSKPNDPEAQHDDNIFFGECAACVYDYINVYGANACMLCSFSYGFLCCDPYDF